jgi:hypothetical protein
MFSFCLADALLPPSGRSANGGERGGRGGGGPLGESADGLDVRLGAVKTAWALDTRRGPLEGFAMAVSGELAGCINGKAEQPPPPVRLVNCGGLSETGRVGLSWLIDAGLTLPSSRSGDDSSDSVDRKPGSESLVKQDGHSTARASSFSPRESSLNPVCPAFGVMIAATLVM